MLGDKSQALDQSKSNTDSTKPDVAKDIDM